VRWYLRYKLSYRDLVEMMAERGLSVAHTTLLRRMQRYAPEFDKRWSRFSVGQARPNECLSSVVLIFVRCCSLVVWIDNGTIPVLMGSCILHNEISTTLEAIQDSHQRPVAHEIASCQQLTAPFQDMFYNGYLSVFASVRSDLNLVTNLDRYRCRKHSGNISAPAAFGDTYLDILVHFN
jgi:hypothetical protein